MNHFVVQFSAQQVLPGSLSMKILAILLTAFLAGCSFSPGNVQSRQSTDLQARNIKRIAVLAPGGSAAAVAADNPLLGATSEKRTGQDEPGDILMHQVYSAMSGLPGWQIISEAELAEIGASVPPPNDMTRLRKIGELVYAEAVMTGRVLRYRERVGGELGVQSPASVAFTLELIDVQRGDVVWSTRFDETQKGLTENIFSLGDVRQRGLRWLTAEQLMQDGVRKVIDQLHQTLSRAVP
jgi:hypothetical protein